MAFAAHGVMTWLSIFVNRIDNTPKTKAPIPNFDCNSSGQALGAGVVDVGAAATASSDSCAVPCNLRTAKVDKPVVVVVKKNPTKITDNTFTIYI